VSAAAANDGFAGEDSNNTSAQSPQEKDFDSRFCIIGSMDTVDDFSGMELNEITDNISVRRNKIFLMMEEVRRLRIQRRLKGGPSANAEADAEGQVEEYVSALPFLPPLSEQTLSQYYSAYAGFVGTVIVFGGVVAPMMELKLGLGGTSYAEFLQSMHLPVQLSQVDPIVASFCGGSVGVLSALLVVEINNIRKQQRNRCHYCNGTGYLSCGNCVGTGYIEMPPNDAAAVASEGSKGGAAVGKRTIKLVSKERRGVACSYCSSTGKVMCTGCLCTGKQLATEHDPRIDPFSA